ncbi:hypothetical protein AM501_26875 [Aneurinibacillus migulanus]|uniref:hypothetical protein n=1 Tax=Aneurinibacillus migulanus TaxID=47500 RepID=UPI0005B92E9E|nr:hypothetical protein [Aneurinibacillus migulanus]KIV55056.1 hypothetical protein TS64_12310 [Aneurinibacillus migulanus]KPD05341.1 hypothetical protein AM501_26875 [Aneurinibacillus migulanus]
MALFGLILWLFGVFMALKSIFKPKKIHIERIEGDFLRYTFWRLAIYFMPILFYTGLSFLGSYMVSSGR